MEPITVTVDSHLEIEQAKEDAYEVLKDRYWPHPFPRVELVYTDTIRNIHPPLYGSNGSQLAHFVFKVKEIVDDSPALPKVKEIVDDSPALPNDTDATLKNAIFYKVGARDFHEFFKEANIAILAQIIEDDIMHLPITRYDTIHTIIEQKFEEFFAEKLDEFIESKK